MKKYAVTIFLFVFIFSFFSIICEEVAAEQIDSSSQFENNSNETEMNKQLQEKQQMIRILKFFLIIIIILWAVSFYFLKLKSFRLKIMERDLNQHRKIKDPGSKLIKHGISFINSNEKLNINQKQYKTLIDNLHEGMVIVDEKENFLFVNKYALEIYGCTESEIIGHNVSEFTDELEFHKILEQTSFRRSGVASKYELIIHQPGGERKIVKVSASPIFDDGKFKGSVGIFVDITEQKRNDLIQEVIYNISNAVNTSADMSEMYKKIHKILGIVINTTNFYIALYDKHTNMIHSPYYVDKINKITPEPQMMGNGLTAYVIHSGKSLFLTERKRNEMIASGIIPAGNWKSKIWLGVPLKVQNQIIGAIAVQSYENAEQFNRKDLWLLEFVSDQIALAISRKRAVQALKDSETFNRAIIENSPLAISARDNKGRLLVANKAWMKLWGKSAEDLTVDSREREQFQLDERDEYLGAFKSRIEEIYKQGGELYIPELQVLRKRSKQRAIWISQYFYALLNDKKKVDKVIIITENITERILAQEELKNSLKEKEILLKEVHHRVKNNMQVISSMLKLQSRYIEDDRSLELFQECQNRVRSMALIHEKLYQSKNFEKLDFDQYVRTLTSTLFDTFSRSDIQIDTSIISNDVEFDMTKAIPCGLIINELVSNSLKHAFKGRKKGNIKLSMTKEGENYKLLYSDDGIGFPAGLDFKNTDSLGMQLVNALTKQLHGEIKLRKNNGTEFQLIFPEKVTEL